MPGRAFPGFPAAPEILVNSRSGSLRGEQPRRHAISVIDCSYKRTDDLRQLHGDSGFKLTCGRFPTVGGTFVRG
jgi:hypothetical protein